ncbi:MAG: hypothetical protein U0946_06705 [Patescibacteria group bacterium]|nr:hypothetical protein [Patescibacteria group bacterium]
MSDNPSSASSASEEQETPLLEASIEQLEQHVNEVQQQFPDGTEAVAHQLGGMGSSSRER